jgi:2-phospho-L-lactate/phosphoenolpyruvate guanylyltransferase
LPVIGVIPVRSFHLGKQRLAGSMAIERREWLGRSLAGHVATVVESAGLIPLIVTADTEVAAWATGAGFPSLPDPGRGLDTACETAVGWARHSGSRWLVLHSDLPLLGDGDLGALLAPIELGGDVIAPSSDGGTSAISARGDIVFSFGPASFHRHLPRLTLPTVIARPGLLQDVDSPADLAAAASHPLGAWLRPGA